MWALWGLHFHLHKSPARPERRNVSAWITIFELFFLDELNTVGRMWTTAWCTSLWQRSMWWRSIWISSRGSATSTRSWIWCLRFQRGGFSTVSSIQSLVGSFSCLLWACWHWCRISVADAFQPIVAMAEIETNALDELARLFHNDSQGETQEYFFSFFLVFLLFSFSFLFPFFFFFLLFSSSQFSFPSSCRRIQAGKKKIATLLKLVLHKSEIFTAVVSFFLPSFPKKCQ